MWDLEWIEREHLVINTVKRCKESISVHDIPMQMGNTDGDRDLFKIV